jgi:hypothetical protein
MIKVVIVRGCLNFAARVGDVATGPGDLLRFGKWEDCTSDRRATVRQSGRWRPELYDSPRPK